MSGYDKKPECPADAEYTVELQARHCQLEAQVAGAADDAIEPLKPAECDELEDLRGLFARFCAWRGKVDAYYADQRKERSRPPLAADPDNSLGAALRRFRGGKRPAHEVQRGRRDRPVFRPSADRTPGTGLDRMAEGLRKGIGLTE